MGIEFLGVGDPGALLGMKRKKPDRKRNLTARCPRCKGYGGWHLELNAYGPGKHFDCLCSNCLGWGYVEPRAADHVHHYMQMEEEEANALRKTKGLGPIRYTYGRCCHNAVCSICGDFRFTDSSD